MSQTPTPTPAKLLSSVQMAYWIARLQELNQQTILPRRRSDNQRTTTDIHEDAQQMLKELLVPFRELPWSASRISYEWQCINCVLIGCLRHLRSGCSLQPDAIVIPHLQSLNHLDLPPGRGDRKTVALHRDTKRLLILLRPHFETPYFRCRWHWRTFNLALVRCLSGNERLIAVCRDVLQEGKAA